jgi:creatinine amidohydrolase
VSNLRPTWAEGLEILRARQRKLPDAVLNAFTAPMDLSRVDLAKYRSVVTTGIGSSSAHARYLAWLLRTGGGLPAWDVSTGVFLKPPGDEAPGQALVVFSQGLSPNARFPLSFANRYGSTVLVTAAGAERGERALALKRAEDAGVVVIPMPVDPEYEVLLRIIGPVVGYAMALRIASGCGIKIEVDAKSIAAAMADAADRAEALVAGAKPQVFSNSITFVATGGYGQLASNLCAKIAEGMFLPPPAAVDVLELAHGFLQEAAGKPRTFIGLARKSEFETELFACVRAALEPQHQWLELQAQLPEPFQIFEHEAAMNILVLAAIAHRRVDQREWPGKGQDQPLYGISSPQEIADPATPPAGPQSSKSRHLADLTWLEIEDRIKAGERTVVIPLGATEQHGPHLPLRVDSVIAGALAERFCARVAGALQGPTIDFGCSSEHMDFPGTVSLAPATAGAVIKDVITSLVRHGFEHLVLFSAHGGNDALLAELEPELQKCAEPARITVVHGIGRISKVWADASNLESISSEISGAHAGEFETSIIAGLRPDLIRWAQMRAGTTMMPDDPQTLFYPSLKNNAPDGVVGDPCAATAERAERYLSAWVEFLIAAYQQTKPPEPGRL